MLLRTSLGDQMKFRSHRLRTWCCAVAIAFGTLLTAPRLGRAEEPSRPPPGAACQAWHGHIAVLLDQHRRSDDLDEVSFGKIMALFYEAQSACTMGRFDEGAALYSDIPLGRVSRATLR
jgi:hypothetical protein